MVVMSPFGAYPFPPMSPLFPIFGDPPPHPMTSFLNDPLSMPIYIKYRKSYCTSTNARVYGVQSKLLDPLSIRLRFGRPN